MGPGFRRDGGHDFFTASAGAQSHTPGVGRPLLKPRAGLDPASREDDGYPIMSRIPR